MYSKEEATKLRQEFWITFGRYMKPVPAAAGLPINWINYKTGVKHVFIKMDAEQQQTTIAITLTHPDQQTRMLYFEQLQALKSLFATAVNEDWEWQANTTNSFGIPLSQVTKTIDGLSIYNKQHWPALISFLKPRLIALDQFWADVKPVFEDL